MSIATRIENMETNISKAYDSIEGLGVDITEVDKNLENLSVKIDEVYENLPKVEGEGTSITLEDTAKGRLKNVLNPSELSQETTTGKNKLDGANPTDYGSATSSFANDIIKVSSTASSTLPTARWVFGNLQANDVIRYSTIIQNSNGQVLFQWSNDNTNWTTLFNTISNYTDGITPSEKSYTNTNAYSYFRLLLYSSSSIPTGNSESNYKNTIVTINNDNMSYEPYTGGIPQPNPTYPSDVHVISGDNSIVVSNSDNTLSQIKPLNLGAKLPIGYTKVEYIESNGTQFIDTGLTFDGLNDIKMKINVSSFPLAANTTIFGANANSGEVLLFYGKNSERQIINGTEYTKAPITNLLYDIDLNTTNGNASLYINNELIGTSTGTSTNKKCYLFGGIGTSTSTTITNYANYKLYEFKAYNTNNEIVRNMIPCYRNSDNEIGLYDVINNQFYPNEGTGVFAKGENIPNGIEYCKIGNYSDHFFKAIDGDSIYDTLDSTTKASLTDGKWYIQKNIGKVVLDGSETYTMTGLAFLYSTYLYPIVDNALSSHFTYSSSWSSSSADYRGKMNFTSGRIRFMPTDENINTIELWKNWLSTHNVELYYPTSTPQYILLNDTLQQQLDDIYYTMLSYQGQTNITQENNDLPFDMTGSALMDLSALTTQTQSLQSVNTLNLAMPTNITLDESSLNLENSINEIDENTPILQNEENDI